MIDLATNRRLTKAFIDHYPVTLTLIPRAKVKKPAGGWAWEEQAPRAPQVMTLVEPGSIERPTLTTDGVERRVEFELVAEWDAQVARGDIFTHEGRDWEVSEIAYDNGWEIRALVVGRG